MSSNFDPVEIVGGFDLDFDPVEEEKERNLKGRNRVREIPETTRDETLPRDFESQFTSEESWPVVEDYMSKRFGMTTDKYDKQDIVDRYVNHMRYFNSGNLVSSISEITHLHADESDELKQSALNAYNLWDGAEGAFKVGTTGEKLDNVKDYAWSIIADPSNLLSLGAGKGAVAVATRAGGEVAKSSAARSVARTAAAKVAKDTIKKEATKKGLSQSAKKKLYDRTFNSALEKELKKDSTKALLAKQNRLADKVALGTDVGIAMAADAMVQEGKIIAGQQDDYNYLQIGATGLLGVFGGGLSYALSRASEATPTVGVSGRIDEALEEIANRTPKKASDEALAGFTKSLDDAADLWSDYVEKGTPIFEGKVAQADEDLFRQLDRAFIMGDPDKNVKGVAEIILNSGVKFDKDMMFSEWLLQGYKKLDPKVRDNVRQTYNRKLRKLFPEDMTIEQFLGAQAKGVSSAGSTLGVRGVAARQVSELYDRMVYGGSKAVEESVEEGAEKTYGLLDKILPPEGTGRKLQNFYIKTLVTNPATTALNVIGWTGATSLKSLEDINRFALYGGRAAFNSLLGKHASARELKIKAGLQGRAILRKFGSAVRPEATMEETMSYLRARPDAFKEVFRYLAGGVENPLTELLNKVDVDEVVSQATKYGIDIPVTDGMSKPEKVLLAFQRLYGVHIQDTLTKSIEFRNALDRRLIDEFGVDYTGFMDDADNVALLAGKGSKERLARFADVEARAVNDALEATFSRSFKKNDDFLGYFAKGLEEARHIPGVGALVPFGQFFNNSVAMMSHTTGISAVAKAIRAGGKNTEWKDILIQASAGISTLGYFTYQATKDQEEGIRWNQERTESGQVIDHSYDFPYTFFRIAGHAFSYMLKGEPVPKGMQEEFTRYLGSDAILRGLDTTTSDLVRLATAFFSDKDEVTGDILLGALEDSVSLYATGVTRPLDPINKLVGFARGEDYTPTSRTSGDDWKEKTINKSIRYVDQVVELLRGEPLGIPQSEATRGDKRTLKLNQLFGYREVDQKTNIEKLFDEISRPTFDTGIFVDSVEARAVISDVMFPILEWRATDLIEGDEWKNADTKTKEQMVDTLVGWARNEAKTILEGGYQPDKTSLIIKLQDKKGIVTEMARKLYDRRMSTLHTLSMDQLRVLETLSDLPDLERKQIQQNLGLD